MKSVRKFAELQYNFFLEGVDSSDMVGFLYNGTHIINPWLDETGRFEVDPYKYYGEEYMKVFIRQYKKEIFKRWLNWFVLVLTGKGPIADKAVDNDLVDLSGQGRNKYGR